MQPNSQTMQMFSIGAVRRNGDGVQIQIDESFRPGLKGLGTFSHVRVFWWAHRYDEAEYRQAHVVPLPYAEGVEAGVFACLSPVRPNLIMTTVCQILAVDEAKGTVQIANIDAFDGTPVLDLKPYYPVTDRVKDARISDYLAGWPEWFPETGLGLEEGEA